MPHLVQVITSAVAICIYTPLALLFTMARMDLNPVSLSNMSSAHSMIEVTTFGIKFLMISASVLVTSTKWLSLLLFALASYLLYLHLYWVPHQQVVVNIVRTASFASIFYVSLFPPLLAFLPGIDVTDPNLVHQFQTDITIAMWAGIIPTALIGAVFAYLRLRFFVVTVVDKFRDAPKGTKPK